MKQMISMVSILLIAAATRADVITWPTMSEWNPLYSSTGLYSDPNNDIGNNGHLYLDIVGGTDSLNNTYSGGYMLRRTEGIEDQLLLRIRVNADKSNDVGAFQVFFETDGDDSVEWVMQLNTEKVKGQTIDTLTFGSASGTNRNGVVFGTTVWSTTTGYFHYTGTATEDGSQFGGDDDYFLDMAMPWSTFENYTGITSTNDPLRMLITSSQSAGQINDGDVGNSSVASGVDVLFKDLYTSQPEAIPEPAVATLIVGAGIGMLGIRRIFMK